MGVDFSLPGDATPPPADGFPAIEYRPFVIESACLGAAAFVAFVMFGYAMIREREFARTKANATAAAAAANNSNITAPPPAAASATRPIGGGKRATGGGGSTVMLQNLIAAAQPSTTRAPPSPPVGAALPSPSATAMTPSSPLLPGTRTSTDAGAATSTPPFATTITVVPPTNEPSAGLTSVNAPVASSNSVAIAITPKAVSVSAAPARSARSTLTANRPTGGGGGGGGNDQSRTGRSTLPAPTVISGANPTPPTGGGKAASDDRGFQYYCRRVGCGMSFLLVLYSIDLHGAFGVWPPLLVGLVGVFPVTLVSLFGVEMSSWLYFTIRAAHTQSRTPFPPVIQFILYLIPIQTFVLGTICAFGLEFERSLVWRGLGSVNIGMLGFLYIGLVVHCYTSMSKELLKVLNANARASGSAGAAAGIGVVDVSHIHAALKLLRTLVLFGIPCATVFSSGEWWIASAYLRKGGSDQPQFRYPQQPPFIDLLVYIGGWGLVLLVGWFSIPPRAPATAQSASGAIQRRAGPAH